MIRAIKAVIDAIGLRKLIIIAATGAALIGAYAAVGFLLVPRLAGFQVQEFASEHYGRAAEIGEIRFNPFTFVLEVDRFRFPDADGQPVVSFDALLVNLELSSLWRRGASFKEIAIEHPYTRVLIRKDGTLNLADLIGPFAEEAEPPTEEEPARLFINLLRVSAGRATFEDRTQATPFTAALRPVSFELRDFSTTGETGNAYGLHARSTAGETFDWGGTFSLTPLASQGRFHIGKVQLNRLSDYLRQSAPVDMTGGILDLDGSYELKAGDTATDFHLMVSNLGIADLAVRPTGEETDAANIASVEISNARLDLAKREVLVEKVAIDGGSVQGRRDETGRLNLLDLAGGPVEPADTEAVAAEAEVETSPAESAPWKFSAPDIEIKALQIRLEDREIDPAVEWKLDPLNLKLAGFSTAPDAQFLVTVDAGINDGGRVTGEAGYARDTGRVEGRIGLSAFDLTVLQPYLDRYTQMSLLGGSLSADLSAAREGDGALAANGTVQIDRLRTVDRELGEDFIKWDMARAEGISYDSRRNALRIKAIKTKAPYARVIIAPDETVNVAEILKPAKPESALTRAEKAVGVEPRDYSETAVAIDSVVVTNGSMNFADFWIQPNYAVSLQSLAGTVTGLSSDPASRAKLELAGKVDRYAPATISGDLNLLSASLYTDIQMKFAGVELSSVTPYSGRFAGYKIEKGKLSIDVNYHVENRQLKADQRFIVDQLQLGERVESPDAVKLPLRLAVALLKDRNGVIDIGLPVSGSLDDPKFRLGPIIWKAFVGLLTKIATAPFALLGRLFGGGEEMNFVEFDPGESALDPAEQEKMASLHKALVERPALNVDVPMAYSPELDGRLLGLRRLEKMLAARAANERRTRKRVDPAADTAALADPERRHELLVGEFRAAFGEESPLPAKALALEELKRKERTPEAYTEANTELEAALIEKQPVPESELETLGKTRAGAIQDALLADGQVDPGRVFVITQEARPGTDVESRVRLELSLK